MKKRVEELVRQCREARKRRLRFEALVTAMSVLVTGSVFWQLRRYGTAISKEPVPAAERPKAATPVVETDADPPDETARSGIAEEPEDWKAELPVFTDETPQQRIAAVARSQLGYTEGRGEVLLFDDGTSRTGYTRYGAWYGNPYGEWNTMFTYFCMYYAEIGKDDIPYGSGCWAWYETLTERDMITPCENEKTGDIIFFDTDSDGEPDRTAIVSGTEETDEGIILSVIEGNREGSVAEVQYLHGGSDMVGMLSADAYVTAGEKPHTVTINYSADSESGIHVEAQAPEGVFPEGTVMQAADVADGNAIQAAADTLGETAVICDAVAIDITFRDADGREIEPADGQSVAVQIALPAKKKLSGASFALVHVDDDGEGEIIPDAQVSSSGASFTAESFSIYLVVGGSETEVAGLTVGNVPGNSAENPYVMHVGETVRLIGRSNIEHYLYYDNSQNVLGEDGGWIRNQWEGSEFVTERNYRANNRGTATVVLTNQDSNGNTYYDVFYVKVIESIWVVGESGDRGKDHIKESLSYYDDGSAGPVYSDQEPVSYPVNFTWLPNEDGYLPNGSGFPYEPYTLMYGDSAIIYPYYFSDTPDSVRLELVSNPYGCISYEYLSGDEYPPGAVRVTGTYPWDSGDTLVAEFRNTQTGESIYFGSRCINSNLNHADMEIADGGRYSITSVEYKEDGSKITKVKVYNAYVNGVNSAKLFRTNDTESVLIKEFGPEHYINIGESGTQYEWTSAFYGLYHPSKESTTYWKKSDGVNAADFDVKLKLIPNYEYTIDENGNASAAVPMEPGEIDIDSALFHLDEQAVIDAYNKCPFTNGLDFTVRAQSALLTLETEKALIGRDIQPGEFNFEIVETTMVNGTPTETVVSSASNEADGKVNFPALHFEHTGDYTYILRECIPDQKDEDLFYDSTEYTLNIHVEETPPGSGVMVATITNFDDLPEQFKFTNAVKYELPSTGGTGTLPYAGGGIILISAAFILPLIRRRKEDECDS